MKRLGIILSIMALSLSVIIFSCKKEEALPIPVITYKVWGKIDTTKTTLLTARFVKAQFTLSYSNINGVESDAVLNGGFNLLNYTGINNRDTLDFYATNTIGIDTVFSIPNDSLRATKISNNYVFNNGDSARFSCSNYALRNNVSSNVKLGKGFFKLGRFPKYVYIKLDSVVKQ
jgi:hypothetical protein